ncbi:MAG: hypothetical protein KatS3mg095_0901 [Candidatus Parcubacteria bacterium]|nr:MAG: hypothetical protein KatS3mg095_0901 [Candidatus Parcubacteria bacterium]
MKNSNKLSTSKPNKRIRRRFIPFFEKLYKIRSRLGELVVNQVKIQVLLKGLIIVRKASKGFLNKENKKWIEWLNNKTLGELIFVYRGYSKIGEENFIKQLENFNKTRNKLMHKINFYQGPVALSLGKNIDFKELKNEIIDVNSSAKDLIVNLEKLIGNEIQYIVELNKKYQNQ